MTSFANLTKSSTSFSNQSKNSTVFDTGVSYLLKEDGDFLLLENGGFIITSGAERVTTTFSNLTKN